MPALTSVLKASINTALAPNTSPDFSPIERVHIDEQNFRSHFLHVEDTADLTRNLVLDVVALIEHERHIRIPIKAPVAVDLENDSEELERIGRTDNQVVVRIEA